MRVSPPRKPRMTPHQPPDLHTAFLLRDASAAAEAFVEPVRQWERRCIRATLRDSICPVFLMFPSPDRVESLPTSGWTESLHRFLSALTPDTAKDGIEVAKVCQRLVHDRETRILCRTLAIQSGTMAAAFGFWASTMSGVVWATVSGRPLLADGLAAAIAVLALAALGAGMTSSSRRAARAQP